MYDVRRKYPKPQLPMAVAAWGIGIRKPREPRMPKTPSILLSYQRLLLL